MAVARASAGQYAGNGYGSGGYAPGGIVTGEAVSLDLRAARLPSRMLASAIDLTITFFGASLVLGFLGGYLARILDSALLAAVELVLAIGIILGFPICMQVFNGGRTIGKLAMGLRVVRDDGGPVAFRQAFTRELIGLVVEKPGIALFAPAVICSLLREDGKRVGDLAAGTVVISDRVARVGSAVRVPPMPPQLAGWASTLDLSRLPDDVALRAREVLSRAGSLRPAAREELGASLVAAVSTAVAPPPPGVPGWAFLAAVLAERHRRDVIRLARTREQVDRRMGTAPISQYSGQPVPGRTVGTAAYDQPWSPPVGAANA